MLVIFHPYYRKGFPALSAMQSHGQGSHANVFVFVGYAQFQGIQRKRKGK